MTSVIKQSTTWSLAVTQNTLNKVTETRSGPHIPPRKEKPRVVATPMAAGDVTTWGSTGTQSHAEVEEDLPKEKERIRAAATLEHDGTNLLAEESDGQTTPKLRNRRNSRRLCALSPLLPQPNSSNASPLLSSPPRPAKEKKTSPILQSKR